MKLKRTQLFSLQDGSPFTMPSCPEFKYLYLVRGGDCTCRVSGYKQNDTGTYVGFTDFFSPATEVVHDSDRGPMIKDGDGVLSISPAEKNREIPNSISQQEDEQEVKPKKIKQQKKMENVIETAIEPTTEISTPTKEAGQRGRKRKHFISLPTNAEFTVAEVALKLGVEKFVIANEIAKIKKATPDSIELVRTISGGKGKPVSVYKLK